MPTDGIEIEVKLAVPDEAAAKRALRKAGFKPDGTHRQCDTVLDTPDLSVRQSGRLLRLRRETTGRHTAWLLTFKGVAVQGSAHKERPEIETGLADGETLLAIFAALGYHPVFVYEKIRTDFRGSRGGVASVDRTPIGVFMELEGTRAWIDRTARRLGFSPDQYNTRSYAALYFEYCATHGIEPSNMVFSE